MRKIDFLITYEVKTRELEYLSLIKVELDRRGYSTALVPANAIVGYYPLYEAEVIINAGIKMININSGNGAHFKKALGLVTEQIFDHVGENVLKECPFDELRKKTVINAWGDNYKKLIMCQNMPEQNVVVYGHPVMDFCKKRFDSFYLSRKEIAKEYNLDISKKWNLFISSFTSKMSGGEKGARETDSQDGTTRNYRLYKNETATVEQLSHWFEKAVAENANQIIIYRPHPVEIIDKAFIQLQKKYSNFVIIRDRGIKQWIKVCDKVYTWYSTSSADAFFFRKPIYVLRPVKLDDDMELVIFDNPQNSLSVYDEFEKTMLEDRFFNEYNVFGDSINSYYKFDENVYTYERISDLCEEMYKNDKYIIPLNLRNELYNNMKRKWERGGIKYQLTMIMRRTPFYAVYHRLFSTKVDYMNLKKGELEDIEKRIRDCIEHDIV